MLLNEQLMAEAEGLGEKVMNSVNEYIQKRKSESPAQACRYGFCAIPDDLEQKRISFMQRLRQDGYTYEHIAATMIGLGQHRRLGEPMWTARSVKHVLSQNPVEVICKRRYKMLEVYQLLKDCGLQEACGKYS